MNRILCLRGEVGVVASRDRRVLLEAKGGFDPRFDDCHEPMVLLSIEQARDLAAQLTGAIVDAIFREEEQ